MNPRGSRQSRCNWILFGIANVIFDSLVVTVTCLAAWVIETPSQVLVDLPVAAIAVGSLCILGAFVYVAVVGVATTMRCIALHPLH